MVSSGHTRSRAASATSLRARRDARWLPLVRRRFKILFRSLADDSHVLLAVALVIPILLIELVTPTGRLAELALFSFAVIAAQVVISRFAERQVRGDLFTFGRLLIALVYVAACAILGPDRVPAATVLFIPVIAMAAIYGGRHALVIGALAISMYMLPLVREVGGDVFVRERGIALAATATVLAIGTRRTVADLARAVARLRAVVASERRKSQQLAGLEEVGRVLAQAGPTQEALEAVMELLERRFHYRYVSIYLGDEKLMRLGAQRGYPNPVLEIDCQRGVMGRVMRTRQPAFIRDVTTDPDYLAGDDAIRSEISVPLLAHGEVFGVVNVEAAAEDPLKDDDLAVMLVIGDRLGAALSLARDREALARRVTLFEGLTSFANRMITTLAPRELYPLVAQSIWESIPCDAVTVTIFDPATNEYRVAASVGWDDAIMGAKIEPGEGLAGRVIVEHRVLIDEHHDRSRWPGALRDLPGPEQIVAAAAPLMRDEHVVGAVVVTRFGLGDPFHALDLEALSLIASQAALAVTNAQLHAATLEASIRDPLTGLYNRRHLDASLERLFAARGRRDRAELQPVAAILFDLDHFGLFNKRHGHQLGDEVLRSFAGILRGRFRTSDIVARYGGEEFVVVLDGGTREEARLAAEEVRAEFGRLRFRGADGEQLKATVSAGCSGVDGAVGSAEDLLALADVGLAMAKHGGRNRVVAA